jgi:hypothetical protein
LAVGVGARLVITAVVLAFSVLGFTVRARSSSTGELLVLAGTSPNKSISAIAPSQLRLRFGQIPCCLPSRRRNQTRFCRQGALCLSNLSVFHSVESRQAKNAKNSHAVYLNIDADSALFFRAPSARRRSRFSVGGAAKNGPRSRRSFSAPTAAYLGALSSQTGHLQNRALGQARAAAAGRGGFSSERRRARARVRRSSAKPNPSINSSSVI